MEAHEIGKFKVNVRLENLTLAGFRGFRDEVSLDFDSLQTLLIGQNGVGKSTILDALAGTLDYVAALLRGGAYNPQDFFNYFDVNNQIGDQGSANIFLRLRVDFPYINGYQDDNAIWEWARDYSFGINLELTRHKELNVFHQVRLIESDSVRNLFEDALKDHLREWLRLSNDPSFDLVTSLELPVMSYYTTRRMDQGIQETTRRIDSSIFSNYTNKELSPNSYHFPTLKKWLSLQFLIKTQKGDNGNSSKRKMYDTIIHAVLQFLNAGETNQFSNILFEWDEDFPEGEMTILKKDSKLYYSQLSSGEKVVLALVADITRQLVIANPKHENPLQGAGIVLVDEIDLHLHPRWQRRIVENLREVFPNIQLIATTHSPLLIGTLSSRQIWLLEEGNAYQPDATYGHDIASIVEGVMDTPVSDFEEAYGNVYRLLALNDLAEAKANMNKLKAIFLEKDDEFPPEFLKLEAIFSRKKTTSSK